MKRLLFVLIGIALMISASALAQETEEAGEIWRAQVLRIGDGQLYVQILEIDPEDAVFPTYDEEGYLLVPPSGMEVEEPDSGDSSSKPLNENVGDRLWVSITEESEIWTLGDEGFAEADFSDIAIESVLVFRIENGTLSEIVIELVLESAAEDVLEF